MANDPVSPATQPAGSPAPAAGTSAAAAAAAEPAAGTAPVELPGATEEPIQVAPEEVRIK